MIIPFQDIYGQTIIRPTINLVVFRSIAGVLETLDISLSAITGEDVIFNLRVNGVTQFTGAGRPKVVAGQIHVSVTGLSIALADDDLIAFDCEVMTGAVPIPVYFRITLEDGNTVAGIATGGTTGQVLAKASGTNYDTHWVNPAAGVVSSVVAGTGINVDNTDPANPSVSVNTTVMATKSYADSLVTGLLDDRGNYDASSNAFPTTGGSGAAGAILKGDLWTISVAGTLGGEAVGVGDIIRALVDTPGSTLGNWARTEHNFGYVAENTLNKDTDGTLAANSDTKYASQKAVKTYADTKQGLDATLTALAGLATGASKIPYSTGTDTFSQLDLDTDVTLAGNSDTKLATQKATKAYADTKAVAGIPQNSKSAAYTTVLGDANSHIFHPAADTTARVWTIDSNANVAYPVGTSLTFVNEHSAGVLTIGITSDTMRLAGAGTTGNRTLAADGIATALKITSTSWIISGTGLT